MRTAARKEGDSIIHLWHWSKLTFLRRFNDVNTFAEQLMQPGPYKVAGD